MLVLLTAAGLSGAWAHEVQLAGIRLGQHAHNVLQVYGQPDTVIMGETGPGSISTGVAVAAGAPQTGPGFGGGPAAEGPGMGAGMGMPGMGAGMGLPGLGMPGMAGGQMPGAQQPTEGAPGAQATGVTGAATRFAQHRDIPAWAHPVQVPIIETETMWCYRRGDVALAFILDRDGYVVGIAIGGKRADWARTALGEPKRTIKLGDRFETVIERYGHPTATDLMSVGAGFSRDINLSYTYGNNIQFALRDMRVRRIYIHEAQMRGTAPVRLPGPDIGARGPASQPAAGMPPVGGVQSGFRR